MNKKILYGVLFLVVVTLWVFVWWFLIRVPSGTSEERAGSLEVEKAMTISGAVESSASDAIDTVNPFTANINPMEGYKNPFE